MLLKDILLSLTQFTATKIAGLSNVVQQMAPYATAATYPQIWLSFREILCKRVTQYDQVLVITGNHYAAEYFSVSVLKSVNQVVHTSFFSISTLTTIPFA
jgi:hypothetical protein